MKQRLVPGAEDQGRDVHAVVEDAEEEGLHADDVEI